MRVRELKYPIAILKRDSLLGGRDAALSSPRIWHRNLADYYLEGGYDDARLIDCTGHEWEVEKITLRRLSPFQAFLRPFTQVGKGEEFASVDMELRKTDTYTLERFCTEMRELALQNPSWWKRHSSKQEITVMFDGCKTFAEAINDIGVLNPPGKEKLKGHSDKVIDLR